MNPAVKKKGIFIPSNVVKATVGTVAAVLVVIALAEVPEARRYFRLKAM
ncbi:DUF6893 family small protein [Streptomyces sporangiiformans]|nr:hypothetical protein [Streptomyces sporangiiformans]